jgi:hypothetical protein
MANQLAVTKQINWRLDGEVDGAKGELEVGLPDPQLSRKLSDNAGQVKVVGYPVHVRQSNGRLACPWLFRVGWAVAAFRPISALSCMA